jgi:hypothetical protein
MSSPKSRIPTFPSCQKVCTRKCESYHVGQDFLSSLKCRSHLSSVTRRSDFLSSLMCRSHLSSLTCRQRLNAGHQSAGPVPAFWTSSLLASRERGRAGVDSPAEYALNSDDRLQENVAETATAVLCLYVGANMLNIARDPKPIGIYKEQR